MHPVVTIESYGPLESGHAPFICAPLPELGGGDPRNAPTLARLGRNHWRLKIALQGVHSPLDTRTWRTGLRSLDPNDFKTGSGFKCAPAALRWQYHLDPVPQARPARLYYYSGWPQVTVRLVNGAHTLDLPLEACGPGRGPGESLWTAALPVQNLSRGWGFFLAGPGAQEDRPPGGDLYRPLGTSIYLADGEIFPAPPPRQRSAPRIERLDFEAPEMDHTFRLHLVLPRDYDIHLDRTYPLVFLNDGQNQLTHQGAYGGWHTDRAAARLMCEGRMQEAVLAAVERHPDRNRAFFPRGERSTPHGQAEVYTELLAGRLFEALRARYRLAQGPLTIIGSSNGAIHALFAGLTRPDAFAAIGCLSYAVMTPERNFHALERSSHPPFKKVYLDSGTRWAENDSDDNTPITYQLRELLLRRGMIVEGNLRYVLGYGDAHCELAWRRRIALCLEFLVPPV